jgi:sugar phosphate isomerase/epimerase
VATLAFGIVSDEIDPSFATAARHAAEWGITRFELRCLVSGRVPAVDPAELETLAEQVRRDHLQITALSPGIFKHPLSRADALEEELRVALPQTIALARRFGAPCIIAFGFHREAGEPPALEEKAVAYLRRAAEICGQSGVRLAVENEPGFWCDTGVQTRRIIDAAGSKWLGANWDACNAFGTTERPYPEGYEAIRPVITNVHVKDTLKGALIQCVPVGEGVIDWRGQIQAIARDRVVQHVTIETHCHPLVESSRKNVEALRRYLAEMPS